MLRKPWVPPTDAPALRPLLPPPVPASLPQVAVSWKTKVAKWLVGEPPSRVLVEMTCGVHNRRFLIEAEARKERKGDVLHLLNNKETASSEAVDRDRGLGNRPSEALKPYLTITAEPSWRCLYCNTRNNRKTGVYLVWICCGHLICAGSVNQMAYCYCGQQRQLDFKRNAGKRDAPVSFNIRVQQSGSSSSAPASALPTSNKLLGAPSRALPAPPRQLPPPQRLLPPPKG